jgi:peptide chain release factor 2
MAIMLIEKGEFLWTLEISKTGSLTCGGIFDLGVKEEKLKELETLTEESSFWEDPDAANQVILECKKLKSWLNPYKEIKSKVDDIQVAIELGDAELIGDLEGDLLEIDKKIADLEIRKMLSGELDDKSCFLNINAGAGGTESCDWAQMLCRMYERWGASKGYKVEIVDSVEGEVAGIKSVTLKLTGDFAYGYTKAEKGVHRLVRISPFDSGARRHTSFASVDVTPEITDDIAIEVRPDEIRVDTFRASGAGGQHVNRTDSAVRITHEATGIVVACQSQRSQLQNKETCMKMLRSKLYEREVMAREESLKNLGGEKKEIAWGSQIRNYVFQPYTLVKDTRTKVESGNIQAVMDGEIDLFINAYLKEFG